MAFRLLFFAKRRTSCQSQYRRRIADAVQALNSFWQKNPALFYGLSFLFGCSLHFDPSFLAIFLLIGLTSLLMKESRKFFLLRFSLGLLLSLAAYFYIGYTAKDTHLLKEPLQGRGYFSIQSVSPYESHFKKGYIYKGKMLYFSSSSTLRNIPCCLYWFAADRPKAQNDYLIDGTLLPTKGSAIFKGETWTAVPNTFSLAEWRFQWKEGMRKFLRRHMQIDDAIHFLSALITGDLYSRHLRFSFQKLGLSHILVISGFHFAFLTLFTGLFLRLFLPSGKVLWLLLFITSAYFFLLGSSPSIQRAWIAIELYLIAKILGKRAFSTQLLGLALLIELMLDPLSLKNIGFQLSFLSCLGILLLFKPFDSFLSYLFPKRTKEEVKNFSFLSQLGFILGSFLRKACSLSLAVNAAIFPVLLWHFHTFPLLSLAYNLFFPFLISLDMALMLVSLLLFPLFPCSLTILEKTTSGLLNIVFYAPQSLQYTLHFHDFALWPILTYLVLLFLLAIGLGESKSK